MSKTETMRKLSEEENEAKKDLEARIELLLLEMNERDFSRAQNFKETMLLLKHLRETTEKTSIRVQNAASRIQKLPDDAAERVARRIEDSAKICQEAAQSAQTVFQEAKKTYTKGKNSYWAGIFLASFLGGSILALFFYVTMPDYKTIIENQQTIYNKLTR